MDDECSKAARRKFMGTSNNGGRTGYVLVWEKDGISHTIIGKIPREEILKIAESIS